MLTVNDMAAPSADQWQIVIQGMRLPLKSGHLSDSRVAQVVGKQFILGEKDKGLALRLIKSGPSHRKFLRQLPVVMEIKAPLYWWKQMDKYSVGTETNSESTMHTLTKKEFETDDFSLDYLTGGEDNGLDWENYAAQKSMEAVISNLNFLRDAYNASGNTSAWKMINEMLPQSYNQTRCWSANYEVLLNIIQQREGHKLGEWKTFIDYCLENVPYLREFYDAANNA